MPRDKTDADIMTACTWYGNAITNLSLELYWGDPKRWVRIQACLDESMKCLYGLLPPSYEDTTPEEEQCPWNSCKDGTCRPICPPGG